MKLNNLLSFLLIVTTFPVNVQGSLICFLFGTPRCFFGLGAVMRQGKPGEGDCKETCGLIFLALFNFLTGYTCGGCTQLLTGDQGNDPNSFHIDIWGVDVPSNDAQAFINSANRWQTVISGDNHGPFTAEQLENVSPAESLLSGCQYNELVDDSYICADVRLIDGAGDSNGNILGSARPDLFNNGIPVTGVMFFDSFDVDRLQQNGNYEDVILHEMGHVLGIGTAWLTNGLQSNTANCPYFGANANQEYQQISGCNGDNVPVEPSSTGAGSGCSHWEENSCLRNELMSSFLSPNSRLSRITVGSLEDVGYIVDYSEAENLQLNGSCCRRRLDDPEPQRRKMLSDPATAKAVAYGQQLLASQPDVDPRDSSFTFGRIVSVLMLEDDEVYGIMVTPDGAI